ncbi:DUF488 domain-containing protein [Aeromicrobium piscarium]|uniref:DUF488 family protein n=1 Tax=Aeromicrobium piscarium TaxID=2590901 RepID=A0A554RV65_9ACTN|nr:DUF488 family protein [Aeromicrobium piscarium]TSD58002.1 DUF488 family protein [Aeromicrobium piscarium]
MTVRIRRIYEDPESTDGARVLVDRLWPRGISKERAQLDSWCKGAAPSTELRRWYRHDPDRFEEFAERYRDELGDHPEALDELRRYADAGSLTLLTATKSVEISHAAVLRQLLREE